jgi:Activator of Hsp90 ATPase homolog 1-like protein
MSVTGERPLSAWSAPSWRHQARCTGRGWIRSCWPGGWPPGPTRVTRVEVDERAGSHYRIWQADPSGSAAGGSDCELAELVPAQRIVFR